jgi:hypothetical protein
VFAKRTHFKGLFRSSFGIWTMRSAEVAHSKTFSPSEADEAVREIDAIPSGYFSAQPDPS